MSDKDKYKTVAVPSENLIIEKKSKFITNVTPAPDENTALEFLAEIRSKYPDATHNVYAYVIDANNIFRYSDDGEPSGTAGMPVLDAISGYCGCGSGGDAVFRRNAFGNGRTGSRLRRFRKRGAKKIGNYYT